MQRTKQNKCTCDLSSSTITELQSVGFNNELMVFYNYLGLSGDGIVNWVLDELLFNRTGRIFDYKRREIAIDDDAALTDDLFRKAPPRTINRMLEMARLGRKRPIQKRMIGLIMMMALAREIHICRTQGACSAQK